MKSAQTILLIADLEVGVRLRRQHADGYLDDIPPKCLLLELDPDTVVEKLRGILGIRLNASSGIFIPQSQYARGYGYILKAMKRSGYLYESNFFGGSALLMTDEEKPFGFEAFPN